MRSKLFRSLLPSAMAFAVVGCGDSSSTADGHDASEDAWVEVAEDNGLDAEADAPPPTAAVTGELRFAGVAPAPEAVTVRLRPVVEAVEVPAPGTDAGTPPPAEPVEVVVAEVSAGAEPAVLSFRADGLPEGRVYQVGVDVADPAAARLQWRGPTSGLVAAGAPPAHLEAVAVRTRLELLVDGPEGPRWVDRGVLSATEPVRTFRWSSDLEGVTAVEIQASVERFPIDDLSADAACATPSGLVVTRRFEFTPSAPSQEVTLDLTPLVEEPLEGLTTLERARWHQVHRGAPFYLRAVPVTATGRACDPRQYGISSWVEMLVASEWEPPPVVDHPPVRLTGSYFSAAYPFPYPLEMYTCYRVIAPHVIPRVGDIWHLPLDILSSDPIGAMLALLGVFPEGSTVEPGTWFCWRPGSSDGGWLSDLSEAFSDVVGGIIDGVAWVVNQAAELYNEIRDRVVDYVAWAVAELTGCEEPCRIALQIAAESGLAAMGLPPSLPDFDALVDQGIDYLAAEIATQIGVPPEVVEMAYDVARRMVDRAKATRGLPFAPWLIPDSGFRPTVLQFDVARAVSTRDPEGILGVNGAGPHWRMAVGDLHVPAIGAAPLRMPVVLQPDFTGLPPVEPITELLGQPFYGHAQRVQV